MSLRNSGFIYSFILDPYIWWVFFQEKGEKKSGVMAASFVFIYLYDSSKKKISVYPFVDDEFRLRCHASWTCSCFCMYWMCFPT